MRYRGKKPRRTRYSSTLWWMVASVGMLAMSVLFCFEFMRQLIQWGMCV